MDDAAPPPVLVSGGASQALPGADPRVVALAGALVAAFQMAIGPNLAAIYAHGSLALGGFRWERSDLDLLVVVDAPLTFLVKRQLVDTLLTLSAAAPPKGIELSIVTRTALLAGAYPLAFELHFSPAWIAAYRADRVELLPDPPPVDPDLATHLAVTRASGVALLGPPPATLVPVVPEADLLASLAADLPEPADAQAIDAASVILNCCRTAAYLTDGVIRSKAAGGAWALTHGAPADRPLVAAALATYERDAPLVLPLPDVFRLVAAVRVVVVARQGAADPRPV